MKTLIKYHLFKLSLIASILLMPKSLRAQINLPDELRPDYVPDVPRGDTAEEKVYGVVGDVIIVAMQVIGGIAILFLIITGLKYAFAMGEEEKISKAKTAMFWIIGGLILLFLAYAIIRFVIKITLVTEEI